MITTSKLFVTIVSKISLILHNLLNESGNYSASTDKVERNCHFHISWQELLEDR
jgi:hypothetical protein